MKYISAVCILIVFLTGAATAQSTKINNDPDAAFKLAKDLYQQNKFSLAYPIFNTIYTSGKSNVPVTIELETKYYKIICGLELNKATAETEAREFIGLEHSEPGSKILTMP